MKIIGVAAAMALLAGTPAIGLAQADKPAAAKPAGDAKEAGEGKAPMLTMRARDRGREDADARECLKFPTNREIHICAEKYRR